MNLLNIISVIILVTFFLFRNSFTLLKGKRQIKKVTAFIYIGRKTIEVIICFVVPLLLILNILKQDINIYFYVFGLMLAIFGLGLMISTRFNRDKDWGFMGDDSGDVLFTAGPYSITRHPYYIGAIFVGVGIYFQLNYMLSLLMIPVIVFILYVIKKEELFMVQKFGDKFLEYKKRVGIIPWLK